MNGNGERTDILTALVVTAIVSAAVGAGVALLCAPQSGRESREWLARRARELKERVATALEQGKDAIGKEVLTS